MTNNFNTNRLFSHSICFTLRSLRPIVSNNIASGHSKPKFCRNRIELMHNICFFIVSIGYVGRRAATVRVLRCQHIFFSFYSLSMKIDLTYIFLAPVPSDPIDHILHKTRFPIWIGCCLLLLYCNSCRSGRSRQMWVCRGKKYISNRQRRRRRK